MRLIDFIMNDYIVMAIIILLCTCTAVFLLRLYRLFPIHLIYRSKIAFESMLDAVDEPLAVISKDYCVRRVNKAYLALTGLSYKTCINAKCYDLLRNRTTPCDDCKLSETLSSGAAQGMDISPHPRGSGFVNITFTPYEMPIRYKTTEVCVIEHLRDITALEKLKNDLERRNNSLYTLTKRLRAARRSIKSELYLARQIQHGLLPTDIPMIDRMKIDLTYNPIDEVGGDLYDFIRLDDDRLGLFIGDASGHGLASALIGSLSKMSLYNHSRDDARLSPPKLLELMNRDLIDNIKSSHYLTCVWCIFDFETNKVRYSKAGHPLQIVLHKDGRAEHIAGDGVFLGIVDDAKYELNEMAFEKGDRFFFFTDGIFDIFTKDKDGKKGPRTIQSARTGEFLGFDGFSEMVKATAELPFEEILPTLKNKLSIYEYDDDYTLIVTEIV